MKSATSPDDIVVVGIDPGPRPGVFALRYSPPEEHDVRRRTAAPVLFECNADAMILLLRAILPSDVRLIIISYEIYVVGNRSSKVKASGDNATTVRMCGQIQGLNYADSRIAIKRHPAAQVMPWASLERLERAGIEGLTKGMPHVRSAAKHALYAAVHDAGVIDPLSKLHKRIEVPA